MRLPHYWHPSTFGSRFYQDRPKIYQSLRDWSSQNGESIWYLFEEYEAKARKESQKGVMCFVNIFLFKKLKLPKFNLIKLKKIFYGRFWKIFFYKKFENLIWNLSYENCWPFSLRLIHRLLSKFYDKTINKEWNFSYKSKNLYNI